MAQISGCSKTVTQLNEITSCGDFDSSFLLLVVDTINGETKNMTVQNMFDCMGSSSDNFYLTAGTYSNGYIYFSGHGTNFSVDVTSLITSGNTYVNGGTFTGNTSASCISNLYVHTLGGCSPINVVSNIVSNSNIYGVNVTGNTIFSVSDAYINGLTVGSGGGNLANTVLGYQAFGSNVGGNNNTAIGWNSLNKNINGSENTAIGINTLYNNTGNFNIAIGNNSLYQNLGGSQNVGIGSYSLNKNTTGFDIYGIGSSSLRNNTTGYQNIGIGTATLNNNTIGIQNVAIGDQALNLNITGSTNVAIGNYAGHYAIDSNELYIDSISRGSNTLEKTNSLIFGKFNSNPLNQELHLNAKIYINSATTNNGLTKLLVQDSDGSIKSRDVSTITASSNLIVQAKAINLNSNSEISTNIIPAGYIISAIVLSETSGNAAGNISIGSTPLGFDVINAETMGSNGVSRPPIGVDFFSLVSTQSLYISSTSWGSGVITVYMLLNKILS